MKWLFSSLCMLIIIFTFAVLTPGTASAFEVNTASVGLTTTPLEFSEHSTDSLYEGLTLDAEFDLTLMTGIPIFGDVVTDTQIKYGGINLNGLDEFGGRDVVWRIGLYIQPKPWLRVGPILSQDESSLAPKVEYAVRIGKYF